MANDPKQELLDDLQDRMLLSEDLGCIAIVFDRDEKPEIKYTKNVVEIFAIAILQEVARQLLIKSGLRESN